MQSILLLLVLQTFLPGAHAWLQSPQSTTTSRQSCCSESRTCMAATTSSRRALLETSWTAAAAAAVAVATTTTIAPKVTQAAAPAATSTTLPNGVSYVVIKSGSKQNDDALKPVIGELVAIRFAAYANDVKIDDIFDNPEPYYTRLGSGGLIAGVEQTLPLMQLGDRWKLTIPVRFDETVPVACDSGNV
jgi:FKBP-type peptidyl-prolyl cis-trans isomerase